MLKKAFKISFVLILSFVLIAIPSFAATGRVTGTNVRIRERADSKAPEISVATKNETVEVIGEEGNWYKVNFETVTGYVSKDYVETDYTSNSGSSASLQPETPATTTPPAQTTEPDPQPTNTTTEPVDNTVAATADNTVTTPENNTAENTVETPDNTTSAPETKPEIKEEQKVTINGEVDLRYLPNFTSRVSSKTSNGAVYTVKASLNNWIKIENETNSGWVLKVKVTELEDGEAPAQTEVPDQTESPTQTSTPTEAPQDTPSQETPASETKKGTVNVPSARIRRSPDGETLDSIKEGTEVTILGEEDGWYKISVEGYDSCYIAKRLINEK